MSETLGGIESTVFTAMREKDPELYAKLHNSTPWEAMDAWVAKYPDDFPMRGMTSVNDTSAIKPPPKSAL